MDVNFTADSCSPEVTESTKPLFPPVILRCFRCRYDRRLYERFFICFDCEFYFDFNDLLDFDERFNRARPPILCLVPQLIIEDDVIYT